MNLIDLFAIVMIALFVLNGYYKGFLSTLLSIGAYIVSIIFGFIFIKPGASFVMGHKRLFNMMLYYTEGSEFITNPEYVRAEISTLSSTEINSIVDSARLPYPMGREITRNIAKEAFADQGITTLGDYFNQTIVCVFINILVFLAVFAIVRLILGLVINGADYADPFPVLRSHDGLLGSALGLVRGMLAMFLIFMLIPIVLTALGQFELIINMVDDSAMAGLFYRMNLLLSLVA